MPAKQRHQQLEQICEAVIAERLGEISDLPKALKKYIFRIYREFIISYLNLLRQKEGKSSDWFPESLSIHPALVDDMRHFFSDHQHITKAYLTLNKQMDSLRKIDKEKQPKLYQHLISSILPPLHPKRVRRSLPGG